MGVGTMVVVVAAVVAVLMAPYAGPQLPKEAVADQVARHVFTGDGIPPAIKRCLDLDPKIRAQVESARGQVASGNWDLRQVLSMVANIVEAVIKFMGVNPVPGPTPAPMVPSTPSAPAEVAPAAPLQPADFGELKGSPLSEADDGP